MLFVLSMTMVSLNMYNLFIYALFLWTCEIVLFLPCDAMQSVVYAGMRCPSVCPSVRLSVTFVDHVKTNKHIFEIFSPSGSHTILVFPYRTGWRYSNGNHPNQGVGMKK